MDHSIIVGADPRVCPSEPKRPPKRKHIRLKDYDYSTAGYYYITICTQGREKFYGDILNQEIILNDAGNLVTEWYYQIEDKFPQARCDEFICMPNHVHFILILEESSSYNHKASIPTIIQWFKTMTTNEYIRGIKQYGWKKLSAKLWQRNYYEQVIRNDAAYFTICEYIANNPRAWCDDEYYS